MLDFSVVLIKVIENLKEIKINSDWSQFEKVIVNVESFAAEKQLRLAKYREAEHQLGRYNNFKNIAKELDRFGGGDVIEFGTWQGLGITMLAKALGSSIPRKFVGIDSFEGLPTSSNGWQKNQFSNTSVGLCRDNILRHLDPVHELELITSWFNDPKLQQKIQVSLQNVAIIHFDCDLGVSLTSALPLIEPFINDNKQVFVIFDDWGCHPDEIPDAFFTWYSNFHRRTGIKFKKYSSTNLTRTYVTGHG